LAYPIVGTHADQRRRSAIACRLCPVTPLAHSGTCPDQRNL